MLLLFAVIFLTVLIGVGTMCIHGKEINRKYIIPWSILLITDFLFLVAKFAVGDVVLTFLYYIPALILTIVGGIWMINISIKSKKSGECKRIIVSGLISVLITVVIIPIPSLTSDDKFEIYKNYYFAVAEDMFEEYDNGKLSVKNEFQSPPYSKMDIDRINAVFTAATIRDMKRLNRSAGVYSYVMADKDVIYFSFGALFQSIDGIAICRNGKDPTIDSELKSQFYQATRYSSIEAGVYHYYGGL